MAQGIVFTSYVPEFLIGVNSASPTLAAEVVTGLPIPTGAFPGNCFYLTEAQAYQLSQPFNANTPQLIAHAGWYMVVQVDSGATAGNIAFGTIGAQKSIPKTVAAANTAIPSQALVTDVANCLYVGQNPCVFLGAVTPGNYTIVLLAGDGQVVAAASQTITPGTYLISNGSTATVATNSTPTAATVGIAEVTLNTPGGALTLTSVAASSAGSAVYTGTITGGTTPNYIGLVFTIAGFTTTANNGSFVCTACSTTTLTLSNANAVAETHAGTATSTNLVRTNVSFPFGLI